MKKLSILFFVVLLMFSCKEEKERYLIVVSKDYEDRFKHWLSDYDSTLEVRSVYGINDFDSLESILKEADGIIISGGEDINPALYNEPEEITRCGKVNPYRDRLEMFMIQYAYKHKIPILGICRGHQMLNVVFGGSLVVDIPEDLGSDTLHRKDGHYTMHWVYVDRGSYLYKILGVDSGLVWSNHHQAVKELGEIFRVSARARDSVVEAIELKDTTKRFILGVQWHPEIMSDTNPMSYRIRSVFIYKVKH